MLLYCYIQKQKKTNPLDLITMLKNKKRTRLRNNKILEDHKVFLRNINLIKLNQIYL